MHYDKFSFLFPPRPENAIPKAMLNYYEQEGYIAQIKLNGTNNVIAVSPDGDIETWTRHGEAHKAWKPTNESMKFFKNLPSGWYVFVAELMHSKGNGIRDTNYLHDILVYQGNHLVGYTQEQRQQILKDLVLPTVENPIKTTSHTRIHDNLWLTRQYTKGFSTLYSSLTNGEYEGLVLKNPKAVLEPCFRESINNGSQIKCRKGTKNFGF